MLKIVKYTIILLIFNVVWNATCMGQGSGKTPKNRNHKPLGVVKPKSAAWEGITDEIATDSGRLAAYFAERYPDPDQRVEAIYTWITGTFTYNDSEAFDFERIEYPLKSILKSKTGVCQEIATLFEFLCLSSGIENHLVVGYTTNRASIGHAWNVCRYKNSLCFFDPTWDLQDPEQGKPASKTYFAVAPLLFNQSHHPYHPTWQLLGRPVTDQEYIAGAFEKMKVQGNYLFEDTILYLNRLNKIQQDSFYFAYFKSYKPVNYAGMNASRANNYKVRHHEFNKIKLIYQIENGIVDTFNTYINFFNNKFMPKREDSYFKNLTGMMESLFLRTDTLYKTINWKHLESSEAVEEQARLNKFLATTRNRWNKHRAFIQLYLSKNKLGRKLIFTNPANNPEN